MVQKLAKKEEMSNRVKKIKEDLTHRLKPQLDVERYKFLLETYKETDGLPLELRRAKLLERILAEKTIYIDDTPIVGTVSRYRAGLWPFPEWACRWMLKEKHKLQRFGLGVYQRSDEDLDLIQQAVDYWQDRCIWYRTVQTFKGATGIDVKPFYKMAVLDQGPSYFPLGFINS